MGAVQCRCHRRQVHDRHEQDYRLHPTIPHARRHPQKTQAPVHDPQARDARVFASAIEPTQSATLLLLTDIATATGRSCMVVPFATMSGAPAAAAAPGHGYAPPRLRRERLSPLSCDLMHPCTLLRRLRRSFTSLLGAHARTSRARYLIWHSICTRWWSTSARASSSLRLSYIWRVVCGLYSDQGIQGHGMSVQDGKRGACHQEHTIKRGLHWEKRRRRRAGRHQCFEVIRCRFQ